LDSALDSSETRDAIVAQYERDGWASVPRLIPREPIDRVSVRIDAVMRAPTARPDRVRALPSICGRKSPRWRRV